MMMWCSSKKYALSLLISYASFCLLGSLFLLLHALPAFKPSLFNLRIHHAPFLLFSDALLQKMKPPQSHHLFQISLGDQVSYDWRKVNEKDECQLSTMSHIFNLLLRLIHHQFQLKGSSSIIVWSLRRSSLQSIPHGPISLLWTDTSHSLFPCTRLNILPWFISMESSYPGTDATLRSIPKKKRWVWYSLCLYPILHGVRLMLVISSQWRWLAIKGNPNWLNNLCLSFNNRLTFTATITTQTKFKLSLSKGFQVLTQRLAKGKEIDLFTNPIVFRRRLALQPSQNSSSSPKAT